MFNNAERVEKTFPLVWKREKRDKSLYKTPQNQFYVGILKKQVSPSVEAMIQMLSEARALNTYSLFTLPLNFKRHCKIADKFSISKLYLSKLRYFLYFLPVSFMIIMLNVNNLQLNNLRFPDKKTSR